MIVCSSVGIVHLKKYAILSIIIFTRFWLIFPLFLPILLFSYNVSRWLIWKELYIIFIHELLTRCWWHYCYMRLLLFLFFNHDVLFRVQCVLFLLLLFSGFLSIFLDLSSNQDECYKCNSDSYTSFLMILAEISSFRNPMSDLLILSDPGIEFSSIAFCKIPSLLTLVYCLVFNVLQNHISNIKDNIF